MQINHPTAHEQQLLPKPAPSPGLCNLFTRTLTSSSSSCNTAESAGTAGSEHSGGERPSRAAWMPSQDSRLLAGCSGARGERTSFREGRSAQPQRRCCQRGGSHSRHQEWLPACSKPASASAASNPDAAGPARKEEKGKIPVCQPLGMVFPEKV